MVALQQFLGLDLFQFILATQFVIACVAINFNTLWSSKLTQLGSLLNKMPKT